MHIFFSGIGGTGIGPLAQITKQAGHTVSGSDKQHSQYIEYLNKHDIKDIHIGQTYDQIAAVHAENPIDWVVFSSAVFLEQKQPEEVRFCEERGIKYSKRDEFLSSFIDDHKQKLIAVAGTHGKTTTTAMLVWLFQQINVPLSWSVAAKMSFADMGHFDEKSEFFAYECDEFDRNFLAFHPYMSLITGIDYDHHEIFPTHEDYVTAFRQFLDQSSQNIIWQSDVTDNKLQINDKYTQLNDTEEILNKLSIVGQVNRRNAWQVIRAVHQLTKISIDDLMRHMNHFPGLSRRFEKLGDNLYSDYAHTIPKIRGCLQTALELSQKVVVVYEPLTNRRQHYIKADYKNLFNGVQQLYWVPSYLAREDPDLPVLSPEELIQEMENKNIAEAAKLDDALWQKIQKHRTSGDLVVCISGGGGNSLDEWIRQRLKTQD